MTINYCYYYKKEDELYRKTLRALSSQLSIYPLEKMTRVENTSFISPIEAKYGYYIYSKD